MDKTDEIRLRKRDQLLIDQKNCLFEKLHKFGTATGFDVAAVVFSIDGTPTFFGEETLLERFMSEIVGTGGELELDYGTVESVKLGYQQMEEQVNQCVDCEQLVNMKIELLELKESKLKGVLTNEEAEARSLDSSLALMEMLDPGRTLEMNDLVTNLMEIKFQCDADAFFICASKRRQSRPSRFHTCPRDGPALLKLIQTFLDYQLGIKKPVRSKKVDVEKVSSAEMVAVGEMSQTSDADIPSFESISASAKQMVQGLVAAEISHRHSMSQAGVAAGNPLSLTIGLSSPVFKSSVAERNQVIKSMIADNKGKSTTTISKADMVSMANNVLKLIKVKLDKANAALREQLGINKPVTTTETDTEFVEDGEGNLVPCRKLL